MEIKGPSGPSKTDKTSKSKKSGSSSGSAFSSFLDETEGTSSSAGASGTHAATPLDAILALQSIDPEESRKAKQQATKRGFDILDCLSEIRVGILTGIISGQRLIRLQQMIEQEREMIDDPHLIEILDEIEIRAAVELAKLGHY